MKNITIKPDHSIISAMKKLELTGERSLIVVTKSSKFLGTLTDGDIRRNIIKGVSLKTQIKKIYKKNAIYLVEGQFTDKHVKRILNKQNNITIPVVDKKTRKYLYFVSWSSFFGDKKPREEIKNCSVVIMSGGIGKRLLPFTQVLPKPLIPVQGKPIIDHIIDNFKTFGIKSFFLTLNFKSKILKSYFKSKRANKTKVSFVEETTPLGTIGSLKLLKGKLSPNFFSINCDIIVNHNFKEIYEFHEKNDYEATIVTSIKNFEIPYGVCETKNNGTLKNFMEKPSYNLFVNTGLYVFKKSVIKYIPKDKNFDIQKLIENLKKVKKKIGIFPINESSWFDVGQWTEYNKTNNFLKNEK